MKNIFRSVNVILTAILIASVIALTGCGSHSASNSSLPKNPQHQDPYSNLVVLYGDPHFHTNFSDGDESPDFAIRYARDVTKLDWCCVTDHSESLAADQFVALPYYRSLPVKYDQPGKFCVLFGYEWTSLIYGHHNVYSVDNDIPMLPSSDSNYENIDDLWAALDGYDVITIPHHPMIWSKEVWWKHTNSKMDRCVEFYSKWGLSLYDGNPRPLVNPRWQNGVLLALVTHDLHYGLIAATDSHASRPGSILTESRQEAALPYARPGFTGVWATSFTREAIFEALKNRHCYGMTGTRVSIKFTVDGNIMGSEIDASDPPKITFDISSEISITRIQLEKISNKTLTTIASYEPNALQLSGDFTDKDFAGDSAYLIIVDLENTDMALSTPVWVSKVPVSGDSVI
ncbi:MAG: DUF3604 domain-containing protein [bacterium]